MVLWYCQPVLQESLDLFPGWLLFLATRSAVASRLLMGPFEIACSRRAYPGRAFATRCNALSLPAVWRQVMPLETVETKKNVTLNRVFYHPLQPTAVLSSLDTWPLRRNFELGCASPCFFGGAEPSHSHLGQIVPRCAPLPAQCRVQLPAPSPSCLTGLALPAGWLICEVAALLGWSLSSHEVHLQETPSDRWPLIR